MRTYARLLFELTPKLDNELVLLLDEVLERVDLVEQRAVFVLELCLVDGVLLVLLLHLGQPFLTTSFIHSIHSFALLLNRDRKNKRRPTLSSFGLSASVSFDVVAAAAAAAADADAP